MFKAAQVENESFMYTFLQSFLQVPKCKPLSSPTAKSYTNKTGPQTTNINHHSLVSITDNQVQLSDNWQTVTEFQSLGQEWQMTSRGGNADDTLQT